MKHKTTPIVAYLSIATMLTCFLFSCKKNTDASLETGKKQGTVYEYIIKLGYTDAEIQDIGDDYLVDGDILFSKSSQPDFSIFDDGPQTEQYVTGSFIGYNEQPNIVLLIDPSIAALSGEIEGAVAMWNAVPNCRINITTTTTPNDYDIRISAADLPPGVCGTGSFPVNARAGSEIKIDMTEIAGNTFEQRRRTVAHEIGHCIGFRHTNWIRVRESQHGTDQFGAVVSAMHILNTPTGNDPLSLMNAGGCGSSIVNLSEFDKIAVQYVYPETPQVAGTIPVFRYYNGSTGDHFYTNNYSEIGDGINMGYTFEGVGFFAFPTQVANSVPVHRWYKTTTRKHFYSTAANEIPPSSINEGTPFFVYPAAINDAVPVLRYYHSGFDDHFYTKDQNEVLIAPGYAFEIVSWFAY